MILISLDNESHRLGITWCIWYIRRRSVRVITPDQSQTEIKVKSYLLATIIQSL